MAFQQKQFVASTFIQHDVYAKIIVLNNIKMQLAVEEVAIIFYVTFKCLKIIPEVPQDFSQSASKLSSKCLKIVLKVPQNHPLE